MIGWMLAGATILLGVQAVGLMLIRITEGPLGGDDTGEAAMYWVTLTGWPFYLVPYIIDRYRRRRTQRRQNTDK